MTPRAADVTETRNIALAALVTGVLTVAVFNLLPNLDLKITNLFYIGNNTFALRSVGWVSSVRDFTLTLYTVWYVAIVAGLIVTVLGRKGIFGSGARDWLYLVLCSLAGPAIVTNGLLKEHWGRARPRAITEFGSELEFAPVLNWSQECITNCSFVSGESSSMFMLFASLAFLSRKHRYTLFTLMLLFGGLVSLIRIGQGGHFTSDCIMAGVLMTLIAALIYWVMYLREVPGEAGQRS